MLERTRARIEGPLHNNDASIDCKGLRYRPGGIRYNSRPFSENEIRTRPSKKRKHSRSRVTLLRKFYIEPIPPPEKPPVRKLRVATFLGSPALLLPDGTPFKKFKTLAEALSWKESNA